MIIRDNFLLILHKNLCCDPSSEPSRDSSDEGSQHRVSVRAKIIILQLSSNTLLIWSSGSISPPFSISRLLLFQPSMTQYRNNSSTETGCQSPTSPHSQPSYSPSQSPGLSPHSWNNKVFEMDPYHAQQQQQTNALQHQFEQFNMVSVG